MVVLRFVGRIGPDGGLFLLNLSDEEGRLWHVRGGSGSTVVRRHGFESNRRRPRFSRYPVPRLVSGDQPVGHPENSEADATPVTSRCFRARVQIPKRYPSQSPLVACPGVERVERDGPVEVANRLGVATHASVAVGVAVAGGGVWPACRSRAKLLLSALTEDTSTQHPLP